MFEAIKIINIKTLLKFFFEKNQINPIDKKQKK